MERRTLVTLGVSGAVLIMAAAANGRHGQTPVQAPAAPSASPSVENTDKLSRERVATEVGKAIKASVNDPDSLAIDKGLADDKGDLVCVEFRARNGFGGMVREMVAYRKGVPTTSPKFWNGHCRTELFDETWAVKYGVTGSVFG